MLGTSSSSFSKRPPPTEQPPLEYGQVPRQPKKRKLPVASSIPVPVSPANVRTGLNIGATRTTQLNTTSQGKSGHPVTQFTSSPSFAFSLNPDPRSSSLTAYSSVGTSTNNTTGFPPAGRYLSCTSAPPSAGLPTDLTRHAIVSTDSHVDVQLQDAPEGLETVPPLLLRKAADEEKESETMEMESKALGTGRKGGVGSPRQHQRAGPVTRSSHLRVSLRTDRSLAVQPVASSSRLPRVVYSSSSDEEVSDREASDGEASDGGGHSSSQSEGDHMNNSVMHSRKMKGKAKRTTSGRGREKTTASEIHRPRAVPSAHSSFLMPTQALSPIPERFAHKLDVNKDGSFQHGTLECSHSATRSSDLPIVDRSCAVLSYFGFVVYRPLPLVMCQVHGRAFPLAMLPTHIKKEHHREADALRVFPTKRARKPPSNPFGTATARNLTILIGHIAEAYGINPKQTLSDISRTYELPAPIPFMPQPREAFFCPRCKRYIKYKHRRSHAAFRREHYNRSNSVCTSPKDDYTFSNRWVQETVFSIRSMSLDLLISADWTPDAVAPNPESTETDEIPWSLPEAEGARGPCAEWLNSVHFPQMLQQLTDKSGSGPPIPVSDLVRLVALPSQVILPATASRNQRAVERGLVEIYELLRQYLLQADRFVSTTHSDFRANITTG
jgi:hypothetical protein